MNAALTLPLEDLEHLKTDDDEPTRVWERPVFFGQPILPYRADEPLPAQVSCVVGSTERTVLRRGER